MSGKPLVIFDGHCGFCRVWIRYWNALTSDRIDYAPSQEVGAQFPQIPKEDFSHSVQLVMPSGDVLSGARGVFTTLTYAPGMAWLLWIYENIPGFAPLTEAFYRLMAAHRSVFYQLTRFTFGLHIAPRSFAHVEWIFLRALALIYLIAFSSFGLQITGLVGSQGILPIGHFLNAVSSAYGAESYWMLPGIFWIAHGDMFLRAVCIAGAAISIVLLLGYFERIALIILYVLYLSLCTAGQDFMSFQWDMLLLEAGFLAIFLGSSKGIVYLFRWLLFRLTFLSGAVKLLSHDVNWRNLSAVSFHYVTQPLPTPIAWYMNQLPHGFQRFSTGVVFFIELVAPFLIFAPRRWRFFGAACMIFLQVMILLTGNYTFFNWLTLALCLFLFDDAALARFHLRARTKRIHRRFVIAVASLLIVLSGLELWGVFFQGESSLVRLAAPFGIVNTYGLFAVMTTTRPEIIVQGSNDGVTWLDYQFKYKPGDLKQPPRWVAPFQPRLDWQMWFAALGQHPPWVDNFMVRLLQGSPTVLALLAKNPFPDKPPAFIRAQLYDYTFTDFATRRATGNWWQSRPLGPYFPQISLADVRLHE